ncbi:MAG: ATP-binding protein [Nitrospira sp.]|nr:ATP-binding protein [Nitrospira sp.]
MGVLIGRDREIGLIRNHIKEMKSFHIYGPEGVGKTALLEYVYSNWNYFQTPLVPILCRTSRTLREILIHIAGYLLYSSHTLQNIDKFKRIKEIRHRSDLKTINSRDLKNIIFRNISSRRFCIILDHLEHVTPKINAFLTPLKDVAMIITASRQSWELTDYNFKGKLSYCLYLVPKLKVTNLSKRNAYLLMEYLYKNLPMSIRNKSQLFKEIFYITEGNPGMMREIFEKAQRHEYVKGDMLNLKLIQIDCQMDKINTLRPTCGMK